ncbi:MAG: hypothetical protein KAY32_08505 [Candidatus Eisenbacteria sp.]|nr:hypothetical protein [Candidatus Eisenbacteria bacterium]
MTEEFNTGTATPPPPPSPPDDAIAEAKGTAWLSYLGILWLIPMLTLKENPFAKFHVKQGIMLCLYAIAVMIVGSIIPVVGWFLIIPLGSLAILVLSIMGIVKSLGGEYWKAPLGVNALAEKWFKF